MKKEKKKGNKKVKLIVIATIALVLVVLALNYDRALAVIRVGDAGTAKVAATGKKHNTRENKDYGGVIDVFS